MSYENDLQEIIDKLTLSNEDRQSYTEDADEIRDYIIERMKKSDSAFAKYFDGTSLTGSYLDRLKIEQPDEFDINIKLKLPYPIRIINANYPGYLFLETEKRLKRNTTQINAMKHPETDKPLKIRNNTQVDTIQYPETAKPLKRGNKTQIDTIKYPETAKPLKRGNKTQIDTIKCPETDKPLKRKRRRRKKTPFVFKLTNQLADGIFCISRVKLQNSIQNIIKSIFEGRNVLTLLLNSGRTYCIKYRGTTVAHTFTATDQNNKKRVISFDFVPSFEFGVEDWISPKKYIAREMPWFAVPSPVYPHRKKNHFIFKISAPHQERELLKDKNNLKNVIRLLKAIRVHNNMHKLASYWIKTVFLWEIGMHNDEFWDQTNGILLIHMLRRLIQYFEANNIPFYWNKKSNLLNRLKHGQKKIYFQKLQQILQQLDDYNKNKSKQDIARIVDFTLTFSHLKLSENENNWAR